MYKDNNFTPDTPSLACADNKQEFKSSQLANLSIHEINKKGLKTNL